jgi:Taurine catabolism dioxygenase TauD, TfdA family
MRVEQQITASTITAGPGEKLGDCDTQLVRDMVRSQGSVYFSGFNSSVDDFGSFARQFGNSAPPRVMPELGRVAAFGFHAEDAYNPWRPDVVWFLCRAIGADGGTPTEAVDGVDLLERMDEGWRTFSLNHNVCFHQRWPATTWQRSITPDEKPAVEEFLDGLPALTYEILPDDTICTRYRAPIVVTTQAGLQSFSNGILHAVKSGAGESPEYYGITLEDGSPVPQELVDHVEKIALDQRFPFGWADGDVAVIDNYRLMHRRARYEGAGRDLRAIHGEEFFGSRLPEVATATARSMKKVLLGEQDLR